MNIKKAWWMLLLACVVFSGCTERKLRWTCTRSGGEQVSKVRRVAVISVVSAGSARLGAADEELSGAIVGELTERGYEVSLVHDKPFGGEACVFEFSIQGSSEMNMQIYHVPVPGVPIVSKTENRFKIRQITLRISSPKEGTIIGTSTVRYPSPTDNIEKVIKDVLIGLDMIREGHLSDSVTLMGDPGQIKPSEPDVNRK